MSGWYIAAEVLAGSETLHLQWTTRALTRATGHRRNKMIDAWGRNSRSQSRPVHPRAEAASKRIIAMCPLLSFLVCLPLPPEAEEKPAAPAPARHVMIYHEPGRFAGWPANHGIWSW